ncbi:MAG: ARMT1-like domain-containing protein, partial [Longimicrobiales bacterium]
MKHYLECYPCFIRQALEAARMATPDEAVHRQVLVEVARMMAELPAEATPVEMGLAIHRAIRERTGASDPYLEAKRESNRHALSLYPRLREHVEAAPDPLGAAVTAAAIGNVIDFGANPDFDLEAALEEGMARGLTDSGFSLFARRLEEADRL